MREAMDYVISIHAPRTGSDLQQNGLATVYADFNPRSPHGERPSGSVISSVGMQFQSTLPARGATPLVFQHLHRHRDFNPRSPHGERRLLARCRC